MIENAGTCPGHNTVCVATAVLEAGLVPMEEPVTRLCLESPGGLIQVYVSILITVVSDLCRFGPPAARAGYRRWP